MASNGNSADSAHSPIPVSPLPVGDDVFTTKFSLLSKKFEERFNERPAYIFRVPGRVNLIGEHVDYCGYPVCPMALQQDILVAASSSVNNRNFLELYNVESTKFPEFVAPDTNFVIDLKVNGWASYFLCGVQGIMEKYGLTKPKPMKLVIYGNVPPGSGLSSSSALVCVAVLTTAFLNDIKMTRTEQAVLAANVERYIGTVSGGMDQAIAFLATKGCAKLIHFNPLRVDDVMLPDGAVFVIGHSMVTKNKADSNDYNSRVIECRLAAQIIAKRELLDWKKNKDLRLADVQKSLNLTLPKMITMVQDGFHDHPYTKSEVCQELGVTLDELNNLTLTSNTKDMTEFKIKHRALHVLQESLRVADFVKECKEPSKNSLQTLGRLMCESHKSLKELFEASHPSLDTLVDICLEFGALGARLTGAGWGGCMVALTTQDRVEDFIQKVKDKFYESASSSDGPRLIFATKPYPGAQIYHCQ